MILVTLAITLLTHNLVIGCWPVLALTAILFSRKVAKVIEVESCLESGNHSIYRVRGQLFVVSVIYFKAGFALHEHPALVTIDMQGGPSVGPERGHGPRPVDPATALWQQQGGGHQPQSRAHRTGLFSRIGVAPEAGGRGGEVAIAH